MIRNPSRPAAVAWLHLAALGVVLVVGRADGQAPAPPAQAEPPQQPADGAGVEGTVDLFVSDRTAGRRLRLAEERIGREDYATAVELLQGVLDAPEDVAAPEEGGTFRSVKRHALDLLGGLPADGRRVYELKYGVSAKSRLDAALGAADWPAVEEVSRRYFHSDAGREATYRLAIRAQDQGEPLQAALLFDRLAGTDAAGGYEPRLSLRAAAAWQAAGIPGAARAAVERSIARGGKAPVIGGRPAAGAGDPAGLLASLGRGSGAVPAADAWPFLGGDFARTAEAEPVALAGGPVWSHGINEATEWDDEREADRAAMLVGTLGAIEAEAGRTGDLTQPAFHPVTVGGVAVVRTLRNLRAVDLATGRFAWQTERPHDSFFDRATAPSGPQDYSDTGVLREEYVAQNAWRNVTAGSISTDGRYVYGVEGVGRANTSLSARAMMTFDEGGSDTFNSLFAYDAAQEGAVGWVESGAPTEEGQSGRFFLGPPLPLGGRLYCLVEENGEILLVVLDPAVPDGGERVVWSQTLVSAERGLGDDSLRRISGLSPTFGDGVLVCPTGAGAAVGIDLGGRHLLWGYQYPRNIRYPSMQRQNPLGNAIIEPVEPEDEARRWLDAVPRIAEGAVLLTPRDSDELHCLDVTGGRLRWKVPRGDLLFVAAVADGKAVVAGRRNVVALDLATGKPAWEVATGEPAGRGVQAGDFYHLPLATGEIATIRLSTGEAIVPSSGGGGVRLGNLIAAGGRLISQSTGSLVAFRRRDEFENELREALRAKEDPATLALRGEDRLHRGETEAGLADLRRAVAGADLPRARRLLAGVLLDGLKNDFAAYRRYAADLDRLTDDPRQRAEYLRRYGDGLGEAGESRAALEAYLRLLDEGVEGPRPELVAPGVIALSDRVLAARITELYEAAGSADRAAMDAALAARVKTLAAAQGEDGLLRFATLFRATPAADEALRLAAARFEAAKEGLRAERARMRLAERTDPAAAVSFDESEAAEIPAEVFGRPYRVEFVPDPVNAGQPGTEVSVGTNVRIVGGRPAEYADWLFEVDPSGQSLSARDPFGQVRWTAPLATGEEGAGPLRQPQARFSGHLMALVVGMRLQAIDLKSDPEGPRLLWTRDLFDRRSPVGGMLVINNTHWGDQFGRQNGPAGFAGAELVVFQIGLTVVAVDTMTGEPVWQRDGIPAGSEISGDRDFVVLQPAGGTAVVVLRAADGSEVAVRTTVERAPRVAWVGTRLVSWRDTPEGKRLECRDVARDEAVWSRDFSAGASLSPGGDSRITGAEEVPILDAAAGRLTVVRLADGEDVFEAEIDADAAIDKFLVTRAFGRYLLFTHRPGAPGRVRMEADWTRFSVDGLAYAIDPSGKRLWSAALRRQLLAAEQPSGLPVLVLTSRVSPGGERADRAVLLDVRTGEALIERSRDDGQPLYPYRTVGDPQDGTAVVSVYGAKFRLRPVDGELPPPRQDGPEALAAPAGGAAESATIPIKLP